MRQERSLPMAELLLILVLLLLGKAAAAAAAAISSLQTDSGGGGGGGFGRDDFPADFLFGAGTSSYQVEGAAAEDGRSPSIWDTFVHAGKTNSTGDVASDGYHKYKEDVQLMVDTGLDSYRFSISWSRLLPRGRGPVNLKGLAYYNNLIDELLNNGIVPHVTLYHFDLPQVLEDEYGGWLSPKIVEDFAAYADVCFREFGNRVKQWTTVVEPNIFPLASYDIGIWPPGRCSPPFGVVNCSAGDSTTEAYIAVHNLLLAHAAVVNLYKHKYKDVQNGWVGINVYSFWFYPYTNSTEDIKATQRMMDFAVGWVLDPLVFGDYPAIMKEIAGSRLPSFTMEQSDQIKGSFDFIGLNHYTSLYVQDNSNVSKTSPRDVYADYFAFVSHSKNETPGDKYIPDHVEVDPAGLQHMLEYIKDAYGNPPLFIEENGFGLGSNGTLDDYDRIEYLSSFIRSLLDAVRNGVNAKGYYVWSFMDLFEYLVNGPPFGLYRVDFADPELKRQPRRSAFWYSDFLKKKANITFPGNNNPHAMSRAAW